jgi:hypothetical protein
VPEAATSTPEITQPFAVMFDGFTRAAERFQAAAKGQDASEIFIALFETLNWAVALDERTAQHWCPDGKVLGRDWHTLRPVHGSEVVRGVGYGRNRVHHQWSDALELQNGERGYPRSYPLVYHEWVWRSAAELPAPDPKQPDHYGKAAYDENLAGQAARVTVTKLTEAFGLLRQMLEPASLLKR